MDYSLRTTPSHGGEPIKQQNEEKIAKILQKRETVQAKELGEQIFQESSDQLAAQSAEHSITTDCQSLEELLSDDLENLLTDEERRALEELDSQFETKEQEVETEKQRDSRDVQTTSNHMTAATSTMSPDFLEKFMKNPDRYTFIPLQEQQNGQTVLTMLQTNKENFKPGQKGDYIIFDRITGERVMPSGFQDLITYENSVKVVFNNGEVIYHSFTKEKDKFMKEEEYVKIRSFVNKYLIVLYTNPLTRLQQQQRGQSKGEKAENRQLQSEKGTKFAAVFDDSSRIKDKQKLTEKNSGQTKGMHTIDLKTLRRIDKRKAEESEFKREVIRKKEEFNSEKNESYVKNEVIRAERGSSHK